MRSSVLLVLLSLASVPNASAEEPKKLVGSKKASAPKLDLALPKFDELPEEKGLAKPAPAQELTATTHADGEPTSAYTLVSLTHGKGFVGTPKGLKTSLPLSKIALSGKPLTTEPFTSVVRVKSPGRRSSTVEVSIVDLKGRTAMEARGQLTFKYGDEGEWAVDWAPTAVRSSGDFQVEVRVGGTSVGSAPLAFAEASPSR